MLLIDEGVQIRRMASGRLIAHLSWHLPPTGRAQKSPDGPPLFFPISSSSVRTLATKHGPPVPFVCLPKNLYPPLKLTNNSRPPRISNNTLRLNPSNRNQPS